MTEPAMEKQPLGETWYHVPRYSNEIRLYTVTKSTSQTVWYLDITWQGKETGHTRQARKGNEWFPTRREALGEIRKRLERKHGYAQDEYSRAVEALKTFNAKHAGELG